MKALILVGGFGTRLRPLTLSIPKPLVEFANKPMILHQIEALVKVGVTDVVLAVNYKPEVMASVLKKYEEKFGITITFSVEEEPLGTAGPLALAAHILGKDNDPFFVLNADVTCDYPFKQMLEFHNAHGAEGTILATKVEEPSKYGVIVTEENSPKIKCFVEKPIEFVGNRINAGIYLFNPAILSRIQLRPTSIEKEIFPEMADDEQLYTFDLEGYWMDVGQPKDFIAGTCLYLSNLAKTQPELLTNPATSSFVNGGNVLVHPTAKIGSGCKIGPNVTIGPNVVIGDGVRLSKCVIMEDVVVKSFAFVRNSIVGWHSTVGSWSRLDGITVLGDDVHINDEIYVNGASVLPHKSISANVTEPRIVM
ncbi:Mannose-1-phosphate guanyltransferase [Smittium mucronatum]|uniref:mannose-1-phosphate guanylyltransferase n=1 Tax=Smittium mucronatum TaxID=133383 RepID=A0A1R0H7M3_9FUNG|nr:Mannose-1-phosphate guanyltransferase [Smittium mucronatum]